MKNSPPEGNNDVHSCKQPNSESTKMKTKQNKQTKKPTEKNRNKNMSFFFFFYVFLFKSFSFQRHYLVWSVPFALWDSSWIIQTADKHCYFVFCSVLENKVLPSDFILPDFVLSFALWFQRGLLSEWKMDQGWGSARRLFFFFNYVFIYFWLCWVFVATTAFL